MGWRDRYIGFAFGLALLFWSALHLMNSWEYRWYGENGALTDFKVEPWEQILSSLLVGFFVAAPVTSVYWLISKIVAFASADGTSVADQDESANS